LSEALRLSRDSEVRIFLPLVMSALGNLGAQQGELRAARHLLLQAKDEAESLGHETSKVALPLYLGMIHSQEGDIRHALELIRACQGSAKQRGYEAIEATAALTEANILVSQSEFDVDRASECLARVVEISTRLEARTLLGGALAARARLFAAAGQVTEAQNE